ncbi:MAG: hypothetical protein WD894_04630 [Pirellulales bacterium]
MSWLTEDSTMALITAAIVGICLFVAFLKTGRGLYLVWLGAVALVAAVLVLVERYVVTDRELIEDTVYGAAAALEANDVDATLEYLSTTAEPLRSEVRRRMPLLKIEEARVADLRIEFSPLELPPKAIATFLGVLKFQASGVPYDRFLRRVTVKLIKHGDRWLVESYELHNR